jgi:hypothetical protein
MVREAAIRIHRRVRRCLSAFARRRVGRSGNYRRFMIVRRDSGRVRTKACAYADFFNPAMEFPDTSERFTRYQLGFEHSRERSPRRGASLPAYKLSTRASLPGSLAPPTVPACHVFGQACADVRVFYRAARYASPLPPAPMADLISQRSDSNPGTERHGCTESSAHVRGR